MSSDSLAVRIGPAVAGQVCVHASMAGMRLAAPLLALQAGQGKLAVGMLVALFALTQVFLSIPAGRFADRHGFQRPLRWAVLCACLGIAAAAIWPGYPVLCVAALLCGGSIGASTIALQRHVGRVARSADELGRGFSLSSLAPAGANIVGPMVAGLLIDHAGFRVAFGALAVLPVVGWLIARRVKDDGGSEDARVAPGGTAWDLLTLPRMGRLMLMNVLITSSWDLHSFMVPVLGHERGISASAIGAILGSFAVAVMVVRVAMPVLVRRLPEWVLITVAVAASGMVLLAYPLTGSAAAMAGLSALLGLSLGSVQPIALTLVHHIAPPHRRGEAMAVRLMFSNATGVVVPMVLGAAGGVLGVSGVFWLMGSLVAACSRFGVGLRGFDAD